MKTIGIDLGTTNSCVYYLNEDANPVLVTDRLRRKIFPSVVYCAGPGQEIVVGHQAKSKVGQQPPPIVAVKRKLGTTEELMLGGRPISPVDVSAHILGYAKKLVETVTGDEVGAAVITVPAYFDAAPRKDTYEAAVRAFYGGDAAAAQGRIELQLEPEAAAFAYTLEDPAERLRILVYDLGGGTFDVTILDKSPDSGLTEIKFGGDPHLGGENVDDRIASWFLYLLRGGQAEALERILGNGRYPQADRYPILQQLITNDAEKLQETLRGDDRELLIESSPLYKLDLDMQRPDDAVRIHKVKRLAEKAKKDLTINTEVSVAEQGAFEDQNGELVEIELSLSRSEFDLLIGDLVARTIEETNRVLAESQTSEEEIDRILLVGGSTRMPIIANELRKNFQCPIESKDPDLIVARGAALRARDLSVVVPGGAGDRRIELDYPRETSRQRISIKGRVGRPLTDYRAYLSREQQDVADVAVEQDRFLLTEVSLRSDCENVFHLEIVDQDDNIYGETEIRIRHSAEAVESAGPISTRITKPIRSQGTRGFKTLFSEGTALPAEEKFECYRAIRDDHVRIPFYEGERLLENLVIPNVDPDLPEGAVIDVWVRINKDYSVNANATVRSTRQSQEVEFGIPRLEIPSLETMDEECKDVLDEIDNDLDLVRDRNVRARLARRKKRLKVEYDRARRELDRDPHKLYATIGELRKVLVEVRGAQEFLSPPFEEFQRLLDHCRRLTGTLKADGPISPQDAGDKIDAHARMGKEAWDKEDAVTWKAINDDLEKLRDALKQAVAVPPPDPREYPPEVIQGGLLGWARELRDKVAEAELGDGFAQRLARAESAIHGVDLRNKDAARQALILIAQQQLRPLDAEINRSIAALTGRQPEISANLMSNVRW